MRDFIYRLAARLHDSDRPLSRNKHFHVFSGNARQALRIDRHLRDLEAWLTLLQERGERPRVRRQPDGSVQLVMRDPRIGVVRTAVLSAEEAELLARHPAGAWALGSDAPDEAPGEAKAAER